MLEAMIIIILGLSFFHSDEESAQPAFKPVKDSKPPLEIHAVHRSYIIDYGNQKPTIKTLYIPTTHGNSSAFIKDNHPAFTKDNAIEIRFGINSIALNDKKAINDFIEYIKHERPNKVMVSGFASPIGMSWYNKALAKERAKVVFDYITPKLKGFDVKIIHPRNHISEQKAVIYFNEK